MLEPVIPEYLTPDSVCGNGSGNVKGPGDRLRLRRSRPLALPRLGLLPARLARRRVPPRTLRLPHARGLGPARGPQRVLQGQGQGLVLITGPTGSGKSSTLAAMMQRIAEHAAPPHRDHRGPHRVPDQRTARASVSQREIGIDTPNFAMALRNVAAAGPRRDHGRRDARRGDDPRTVLTAGCETGHLVLSTLHTNDAVQTIDRIITTFPESNHRQIRQQLATCLEAVVSLQLARGPTARAWSRRWRSCVAHRRSRS